MEHFDVLVIGAGLSGIGAGHYLQTDCPGKSYVILEQRERIGGTWDLFRYPGIRSDSDMLTMGYSFRPWTNPKMISDGHLIRDYIIDAAREESIDRHIRFGHEIKRASWSSQEAWWTVEATRKHLDGPEEHVTCTCNFLLSCAGYYRYSAGYEPEFPGLERFRGRVVHPQQWPEDFDCAGKRVLVIGSGATAVTLVPALAKTAAHVTMLQRSPTYIISMPEEDAITNWLRRVLPAAWAYRLGRWKNVGFMTVLYQVSQRFPGLMKSGLLKLVRHQLGPDYDIATHFTPRYNPWEQRMCLVPDADLFVALRQKRASVVTDRIATFTEKGVKLESGGELEADIVITATGLAMQPLGGIDLVVDGRAIDIAKALSYKGVMVSGVPNLAAVFGYINASWTLKADLICAYVCRLLNLMEKKGAVQVTPNNRGAAAAGFFVENFSSGYMRRALGKWPRQGTALPWRVHQNYFRDLRSLKWSAIDDGALEFSSARRGEPRSESREPLAESRVGQAP
jgi:monooxygenase